MRDGVEVYKLSRNAESGEEEREVLGKSAKAGQMAVAQSAASRVFTNVYVKPGPAAVCLPMRADYIQTHSDNTPTRHDLTRETKRLWGTQRQGPGECDQSDPE
jgi:hypothetical protein